ncbi:hypothetical protein [uncultured Amphritea sp.]|uniref:hypothetical protein n=1 Tax=uncultured Amphritea sp. TaxID=981605 RepID=UPI002605EC43|nr:hypothetical protein [uncultured Amphritea sp.]
MALADVTFKLYEDAALITQFTGPLIIEHQSDLSDGNRDYVLYFGSLSASTQLQTTVNPGVDDITITPVDILPEWVASTAAALDDSIEPTAGNNRRYVATTAGTTGATEPTWPTAIGSAVADGSVIWTCVSETHEPTEFKVASTNAGLDAATAGAGLALGNTLLSGSANAVEVHIRVTNTVTTLGDNSAQPEIGFNINDVTESAQ